MDIEKADCPFCGANGKYTEMTKTDFQDNDIDDLYSMKCWDCNCDGPTGPDEETALALWNQRKG